MQTRDRVRLDADVYYPDGEGPFPILLMRQPYGRAIASTVVYAPPSWYAAHGYIVVIQDVRGRGTSEGEFSLFATEIDDGVDTITWATSFPNSTGAIGMYGFSYQGMTQLYAAIGCARDWGTNDLGQTPLKTLSPAMVGYDLYHDWAYEGGAFCLHASWGWAVQLAAETARRQGDRVRYTQLYNAARNAPDCDPVSGRSPLLDALAPDSFYHDWLNHPSAQDDYWQLSPHYRFQAQGLEAQELETQGEVQGVDLPMLHVGGWFDPYMRGTLRLYRDMIARSRYPHVLMVGPWPHLPWGQYVGDLDFGRRAISPIDRLQISWFDHILKGKDTGMNALQRFPTQLFVMSSGSHSSDSHSSDSHSSGSHASERANVSSANEWRGFPTWPTPPPTVYQLQSIGLASIQAHCGRLVPAMNTGNSELENSEWTENADSASRIGRQPYDTLIHDPWRPVPPLGGHATFPAGPKNRAALDERSDILTYTTSPFEQEMMIVGEVSAELYCWSDAPSFDLCGVLSDVHADGRVYGMVHGYQRVSPNLSTPTTPKSIPKSIPKLISDQRSRQKRLLIIQITFQPTCLRIEKGHALRFSVSGACYPAYAVNPGNGLPPGQGELLDAQVITVEIYWGDRTPSKLWVPYLS